jgi:phage-related protein
MTRKTFTWFPEYETQLNQTPSVTITKFGDGYEQRTANGINNAPEQWTLQFTMMNSVTPEVLAFVQARNAIESFYWTTPLGQTKVFVCRKWRTSRKQGHYVINLDFEQVFEV